MVAFRVHIAVKDISKSERQAGDLPIANSDTIVWQPVHIDADIVQGYLANYSSNNV